MPKKLIIANVIIFLLLICSCMISIFIFQYAIRVPISQMFAEDWLENGLGILIIIAIIILISILLSLIPIKKATFWKRFGFLMLFFNSAFLSYAIFSCIDNYLNTRQTLEKLESEYIKRALKDIENDEVKEFYLGGFMLLDEEETSFGIKRDSIYKKYGITLQDTGCLYNEIDEKAKEKYYELVKPYLDQRNGKNWQEKLEKELSNIEK